MELTGKCKDDFELYFTNKYFPSTTGKSVGQAISIINKGQISLNRFYYLQPEMQWGVYVDFFTHKGIRPSIIDKWPVYEIEFSLYDGDKIYIKEFETESLSEARKAVIEKANEIYNSN